MSGHVKPISGRFGRLVVVRFDGVRFHTAHWLCRCDCGREVSVARENLRTGNSRSCGCARRETTSARAKHGGARPGRYAPEYRSWQSMLARCRNPHLRGYIWYGGRGVTVCARWSSSYAAFLADLGPRPPGTTLERIDNNGNYEPGNVRWATPIEQGRNKRDVRLNEQAAKVIRTCTKSFGTTRMARLYGVSVGHVRRIVTGRCWQ